MIWEPEASFVELGSFDVTYAFAYAALALLLSLLVFIQNSVPRGVTVQECFDWLPYGIAGGLGGARVGYFLFEIPAEFLSAPRAFVMQPGFSFHGGIIFGLLVSILYARHKQRKIHDVFDRLSLPALCAFFLLSLGAMFDPKTAGSISDFSFSARYPLYDNELLDAPRRHPVQLYQALWSAFVLGNLAVIDGWLKKKQMTRPFLLSGLALSLSFLGLFFIDGLKEQKYHVNPESARVAAQMLDFAHVACGMVMIFAGKRWAKSELYGRARKNDSSESSPG